MAALLFIGAVIGGAGVFSYPKLAAQPANQPEANTAAAVTREQQQLNQAIQNEAERLQTLATAVVTPDDKLKASLDELRVGEKMKSLLKARLAAAKTEVRVRWRELCENKGTFDLLIGSSRRLLEAERDLSTRKADQVIAWESHLQRMEQAYVITLAWFNKGWTQDQDLAQMDYYRLDAAIGLERAKAQLEKSRRSSE
jgi:hypothetical protein